MSEQPPIEPPDDELQRYITAFREVEMPTEAAQAQTWSAIESKTRSARLVWLGAGILAAAAVIALFVGLGPGWLSEAHPTQEPSLAPYEHESGDAVQTPELRKPLTRPTPSPAAAPEPDPLEDVVVEPPPKPTRKRAAGTGGQASAGPSDLAAETELFREIQLALANRRGSVALRLIAEHKRNFPRGSFRLEREVLRARALCQLGRRAEARKLAERFITKHPNSPLAPQMKKICASEKTVTDPH